MNKIGDWILIIGDLHIPQRAVDIPLKLKEYLTPGKLTYVLCTGNIGNKETREWVESLGTSKSNVYIVKGDCDDFTDLPETKTIEISGFKIGLVHGHQVVPWGDVDALSQCQRELECDILISGHTHASSVNSVEGKYLINPGSATGAYSGISDKSAPSFIIMSLVEDKGTIYTYTYKSETEDPSFTSQEIVKPK